MLNDSLSIKVIVCSLCQFLWCKYSHHDRCHAMRVMSLKGALGTAAIHRLLWAKRSPVQHMCECVLSRFSHVWLFVTLWTVTHQVSLSMEIFWARILEWVAIPSSRGSSWPQGSNLHLLCLITHVWSINLQQRRQEYMMEKRMSSISCSGKTGQLHVKEWN